MNEADVKKAQRDQEVYWSSLAGRTNWFKKATDEDLLLFLNDSRLPTDSFVDNRRYKWKVIDCVNKGYIYMARWWLSQFVDSAIDCVFTTEYNESLKSLREQGIKDPSKKAIVAADKRMNEVIKGLKTWAK